MSGDPEQEYFADGMVEEIITALSRIRWVFVIARNSSFTYKGQAVDIKQVGRELGVRTPRHLSNCGPVIPIDSDRLLVQAEGLVVAIWTERSQTRHRSRVGAVPARAVPTRPCPDRAAHLNRLGGPDPARC
jgi:hypothetical protein